ncbi:MAG TPA: cytidine deaminase [Firmicutes bacterium]|nr:cytidine deaminase [Bacillota bacterium]
MDDRKLVQMAREVLPFAYAPYSGYRVGAALLTDVGRVFRGVNIENASSGLTICAERAAVAAAVTAGYRSFSRIAVVSEDKDGPVPCGACCQVLSEFSGGKLKVLVSGKEDNIRIFTLRELFPHPFVFYNEAPPQER